MIKCENISLCIKEKKIFDELSFHINEAEMVSIVGVSGSGKTSLLNCLGLIKEVSLGKILIDGKDSTHLPEKEKIIFWRDKASFVFQDYGILDEESVIYYISLTDIFKNQDLVTTTDVKTKESLDNLFRNKTFYLFRKSFTDLIYENNIIDLESE